VNYQAPEVAYGWFIPKLLARAVSIESSVAADGLGHLDSLLGVWDTRQMAEFAEQIRWDYRMFLRMTATWLFSPAGLDLCLESATGLSERTSFI
jgi:hypothetical protein